MYIGTQAYKTQDTDTHLHTHIHVHTQIHTLTQACRSAHPQAPFQSRRLQVSPSEHLAGFSLRPSDSPAMGHPNVLPETQTLLRTTCKTKRRPNSTSSFTTNHQCSLQHPPQAREVLAGHSGPSHQQNPSNSLRNSRAEKASILNLSRDTSAHYYWQL